MAERYKYKRKNKRTGKEEVVVKWRAVVTTESLEAAEGLNTRHADGKYEFEWKRGTKKIRGAKRTVYRLKKMFGSGRAGKAQAQRWEKDRYMDLRMWRATRKSDQRIETRMVGPLVELEVDAYLNSIRGVYHPNTFENKERFLKTGGKGDPEERIVSFATRFETKPLNEIGRELIENYLDALYPEAGDQVENRKYNAHLKEVKAFFTWVTRRHKWTVNPAREIENRPTKMAERKVARLEDVQKMIDRAKGQDRNMIATLWWTGARREQVLGLRWEDIDWERKMIRMLTAKSKNGAIKSKNTFMLSHLEPYLRDQENNYRHLSKDGYVFINLNESHKRTKFYRRRFRYNSNFVTRMADDAGVPRFSFHAMRRGLATHLYRQGVAYESIQAILGHDDVQTTKIYIHEFEPLEAARQDIEGKV